MSNFPIKVGNKSGIDTYVATLTNGEEQLLITREGKQYLSKGDGTKIELSDFEVVSSLPSSPDNKIYILNSNFSLNYYDSSWHTLGSNQIIIGTTSPTDTNKLWLDTTSTPILKWHNGTSWINISGSVDTSNLLDKATYKGSADGIVKKADTLTGLVSTPSQIDNTVNNAISVDNSNRTNGRVIGWNNGQNEYLDITVTGIVGSTGNITNVGNMISIASGEEKTFVHPSSADENIMINVQEEIEGSSVTDTHVDFTDSSKYSVQDSGKILIGNNKVELDIYTKLIMHMDDSSFTDSCGRTIVNHSVSLNTTYQTFGTGCAYFNGSSYFTTPNDICNFGTSDFTIDFIIKMPTSSSYPCIIGNTNGSTYNAIYLSDASNNGKLSIANGSGTRVLVATKRIDDNIKHHIVIQRKNGILQIIIDGSLDNSINYTNNINWNSQTNIFIGWDGVQSNAYFTGYIDELRIIKGIGIFPNSFIPYTQAYNTPYSLINIPIYMNTTGLSNLSLTSTNIITSLTIPVATPTNTSLKCLFSVNNGTDWLYKDGTGIHKYTGDLTQSWTSSNSNTELQTYFTNLTMTQFATDLSSLGIEPISLDFAFQLNTTDITVTPSVSAITMVYGEIPHTELASFGSYSETYVRFGVKRINSSTLGVKNLTSKARKINVNVLLKTS